MKSALGIFVVFVCLILSGCGGSSNAATVELSASDQLIGTWIITEHATISMDRFTDIVIGVIFRADGTFDVINTSEPSGSWVVEGESCTWEMTSPNYFGSLTWSVLPGNYLRLEYPAGAMFLKHMSDFSGSQFSVLNDYSVWEKQP